MEITQALASASLALVIQMHRQARQWLQHRSDRQYMEMHQSRRERQGYCAYHVVVQPNFRRYYFNFLPDQAQIHLDHFNVLDEL